MDYVQRGILKKIEMLESGHIMGKYTLLSGLYKVLLEYQMYLLFACEWSHASSFLSQEKKHEIINELKRPVAGNLLGAILTCDENDRNGLLQGKKKEYQKNIKQFIEKRNRTSAHGTVIPNLQESLWEEVYECYKSVYCNIQNLNIAVLSEEGKFYYRDTEDQSNIVAFDANLNSYFVPLDMDTVSDLGLEDGNLSYLAGTEVFRVYPFLLVRRENNFEYSFFYYSSYNTANNKFEYCKVSGFDNQPRHSQMIPGYFQSFQSENQYTFCKANGIICNKFENNYDSFIAIEPITTYVSDLWAFIHNSRSNVCMTIRGGGGVGKTALIQYVCTKFLFEPFSLRSSFEYVIFCSAKDRELKQVMNIGGAIQKIRTNDVVRDYMDMLKLIGNVLGLDLSVQTDDQTGLIEQAIIRQNGLLLIIDDFETFENSEKKKIVSLISRLSIDKHKVIITTRSQYMIGEEYYICQLTQKQVLDFMKECFLNKAVNGNGLAANYEKFISDKENKDYIYKMSQGLPLLALQLVKVLTLSGFVRETMPVQWSEDVQEFLLGRLYTYFNTKTSKILFIAIAQYYKCGSSDISLSELAVIYKLYCMYFKLDYVDYEMDLQELEKLKIIYLTPDYIKVSNNISGNLLEKCKGEMIAKDHIDRIVFDDRLISLCISNGLEKAVLEYLQIPDRYMTYEFVELFALDNCLNYLNTARFEIIQSYINYKIGMGENEKLHHLFNQCKSYFVMEDEFNEFFSNICLGYSYIVPELEEWMNHRQKKLSPEYLITKLSDELGEIMDDIQMYIACRRKADVPHRYKIELRQSISGKIGTVSNYTIKELCNYNLDDYLDRLWEIQATIEEICVVPEFNMMEYEACRKLLSKLE